MGEDSGVVHRAMYVKTSVRKIKNGDVRELLAQLGIDPPRKIDELTPAT